uniref:Myosin-6-like n=1 Tax=Caenorhabditis tropicalis TaxID=1561998 RepID=A0A1I7V2N4_9PELO
MNSFLDLESFSMESDGQNDLVPRVVHLEALKKQEDTVDRFDRVRSENEELRDKVQTLSANCKELESKLKMADEFGKVKIQLRYMIGTKEEKEMKEEIEKLKKDEDGLRRKIWIAKKKDESDRDELANVMEKIDAKKEELEEMKKDNITRSAKKMLVDAEVENKELRRELNSLTRTLRGKDQRIMHLQNQLTIRNAENRDLRSLIARRFLLPFELWFIIDNFEWHLGMALEALYVTSVNLGRERNARADSQRFISRLMQNIVLDKLNEEVRVVDVTQEMEADEQVAVAALQTQVAIAQPIPRIRWSSSSWDVEVLDDLDSSKEDVVEKKEEKKEIWMEAKGKTWKSPKIAEHEFSVEEIRNFKRGLKRRGKKGKQVAKVVNVAEVVSQVAEEIEEREVQPASNSWLSNLYCLFVILFLGLIFGIFIACF